MVYYLESDFVEKLGRLDGSMLELLPRRAVNIKIKLLCKFQSSQSGGRDGAWRVDFSSTSYFSQKTYYGSDFVRPFL